MDAINILGNLKPYLSIKGSEMPAKSEHGHLIALNSQNQIIASSESIDDLLQQLKEKDLTLKNVSLGFNNKENAICLW